MFEVEYIVIDLDTPGFCEGPIFPKRECLKRATGLVVYQARELRQYRHICYAHRMRNKAYFSYKELTPLLMDDLVFGPLKNKAASGRKGIE